MSTGAIVLMVIGCVGLWGGFAVSCSINFRTAKEHSSWKGAEDGEVAELGCEETLSA